MSRRARTQADDPCRTVRNCDASRGQIAIFLLSTAASIEIRRQPRCRPVESGHEVRHLCRQLLTVARAQRLADAWENLGLVGRLGREELVPVPRAAGKAGGIE